MAPQTTIYRNNVGGTNLRANEADINQSTQGTEMSYLCNVEIYREGGFSAQKGNKQLNVGVTDTTAILGIGEYKSGPLVYAIYTKASGNAYAMDSGGGVETLIMSGLDTAAVPNYVNFNDAVVVFNGVDDPWKWNGTGMGANLTGTPTDWMTTKPNLATTYHGGRIFAAAGSTLYFCALGNENDWTTAADAGQISDLFNDNTTITALAEYGGGLAIHTQKPGIFLLTGQAPLSYTVTPVASNRACAGAKAIATINDFQYFFAGDGILPLITTELGVIKLGKDNEITYKIKPFITGTEPELPLNPIDITQNSGVILLSNYKRNELLAYFKTTGNTQFDTVAIYNFDLGAWTFRQANLLTAACRVNDNILTGTSGGLILQEFFGYSTVTSAPFVKTVTSPFFDFGSPVRNKRITRAYFWVKSNTNTQINLSFKTNYQTPIRLIYPLVYSNSTSAYGSAIYGTSTYASSSVVFFQFPLNITGYNFQFTLSNSDSVTDFRIICYGFEYEDLGAY